MQRAHCVCFESALHCALRVTKATFILSKALFPVCLNHEPHTRWIHCFEEHITVFHDDTFSYSEPMNEPYSAYSKEIS